MNKNKQANTLLSLLLISLSFSTYAQTGKLYKWVDENGRITYQENPPPPKSTILKEENLTGASSDDNATGGNAVQDPVLVYTIPSCSNCAVMINELKKLGVPFTEKNLNSDREIQNKILKLTNSITAPALFVKGELLNIADNLELAKQLKEAGYTIAEQGDITTNENTDGADDTDEQASN